MAQQQKEAQSFIGLSRLRKLPDETVWVSTEAVQNAFPVVTTMLPEVKADLSVPPIDPVAAQSSASNLNNEALLEALFPLQQPIQDTIIVQKESVVPADSPIAVEALTLQELEQLKRKLYQAMNTLAERVLDEHAAIADIQSRMEALLTLVSLYRELKQDIEG